MEIKLIRIIGLIMTLLMPSVYGFERITSPGDALSKELGVIHLIGNKHDSKKDKDQDKLLKKLAFKEGKIILGLGRSSEGRDSYSAVFGNEEQCLRDLSQSIKSLKLFFNHLVYKKRVGMTGLMKDSNEYGDIVDSSNHHMKLIINSIFCYINNAIAINDDPNEKSFVQAQIKHNQVLINLCQSLIDEKSATLLGSGRIYKHVGTNSFNDNFWDNLASNNREWFVLLMQSAQYLLSQCAFLDEETFKSLNDALVEFNSLYAEIEICRYRFRIKQIRDRLSTIDKHLPMKDGIDQKKLLEKLTNKDSVILNLEVSPEEAERDVYSSLLDIEKPTLKDAVRIFTSLKKLLSHVWYKELVALTDLPSDENAYKEIVDPSIETMKLALQSIWFYLNGAASEPQEMWFLKTQINQGNQVLMHFYDSLKEERAGLFDGSGRIYKHVGTMSTNDNFYDNLANNNSEWFALLMRSAHYYIRKSVLDMKSFKNLNALLVELNSLYEEMEICTDRFRIDQIGDRFETIMAPKIENLRISLRNEVVLNNICRAYNEKKHLDKPFFAIIEAKQVAFLRRNLIAQGYAVAVNDGVYDYASEEIAEKSEL